MKEGKGEENGGKGEKGVGREEKWSPYFSERGC